jgi:hypothetical protein
VATPIVKRGEQVVHGDKELVERLGRNDPNRDHDFREK